MGSRFLRIVSPLALVAGALSVTLIRNSALAQVTAAPDTVLFEDVRIFAGRAGADGRAGALSPASNVLVRANRIENISTSPIAVDRSANTTIIHGGGRTLMPGLIDAHVHIAFGSLLLTQLYDPKTTPEQLATAAASAGQMLMRGFTAVRDMGGRFSL